MVSDTPTSFRAIPLKMCTCFDELIKPAIQSKIVAPPFFSVAVRAQTKKKTR